MVAKHLHRYTDKLQQIEGLAPHIYHKEFSTIISH